ncbi:MAG: efflux RND transporter periplasmic adaptor subunit [Flavobacteriales bacterium]|jgi:RND family efflux transporter MFP subunit|nr:efflux RND transporter periplasmic adaptor subunit [Flavobacteriales bacterium]MBK9598800.1 efflux RND transporter periplasmic adaptor subunit [Flavobacteriales bacterium]
MKKSIYLIPMLALLASCGAKGAGELAEKRAERDSLKTVYDKVGKDLKKVEDWLALNDSTANRSLPLVSAKALVQGPFTHYIDVHGVVKADESATLYSMTGGRVASIRVKAGDKVRKGDLIATMDNDMVEKQIAQAQAGADLARTTFEKQQKLWGQHIGSEMQFLQAKTQKEQAEAGLATLKEQQRLSNVTAPFDGMVDEVMARVGDMAAPQMPVARVVNLTGIQLQADVSEAYLKRVRAGAPTKVVFPSINEGFSAPLTHVGDYIDPSNRTFLVTLRAPKGEAYMRPNLLGDLSIQDSHTDSAMVVPSAAVLDDVGGNSYLFVLGPAPQGANVGSNERVAQKIFVDRVSEYQGRMNVAAKTAGELKDGAMVVIDGAKNVSDGQTVRVDEN